MIKKANIRVQVSGVKGSLMHLEARKANHLETLFVTWCKVSDDGKFLYSWQLMHQGDGEIKAADAAAEPVTHQQLGEAIEELVANTFVDNTFGHIDQADFSLLN